MRPGDATGSVLRAGFRPLPSGIRGYRVQRCPRCWMERTACICDLLPRLATRTRVLIVMPWKESARSSNTGRLAHLALPNSEVRLRGQPQRPLDLSDLTAAADRGLVLFPGPAARPLEPLQPEDAPPLLVVPDGTWRQARRVVKHERALAGFRQVRLPPGPPSRYRLRKPRRPGWLCTYEALARALDLLEGGGIEQALLPAFEAMVERTLRHRGRRGGPQPRG